MLVDFQILDVQIERALLGDRLMATLSAGFGLLAACLSTLGLYGVMSYVVVRRRNEIGIRVALGATRANVYGLVARDATIMTVAGLLLGVCASLFLSRYAESLLFDLKGRDPLTLIFASLLLAFTATVATLLPARRAAQVDPIAALRTD
jgi:ABC-type antimicrobial peptide transport system permease subunit